MTGLDLDLVALALGAGLVAAVNPCVFALLPVYLSLFVLDEEPSRTVAVGRALRATAAMTAGFAGVFALFGLAIAPVASSVQQYLPGFTVAPLRPSHRPRRRSGSRGPNPIRGPARLPASTRITMHSCLVELTALTCSVSRQPESG